jgi:hypothetical protein
MPPQEGYLATPRAIPGLGGIQMDVYPRRQSVESPIAPPAIVRPDISPENMAFQTSSTFAQPLAMGYGRTQADVPWYSLARAQQAGLAGQNLEIPMPGRGGERISSAQFAPRGIGDLIPYAPAT